MAPKAAAKATKAPKAKAAAGDKPKRAPSPYINFCTEQRPKLKDANPGATFGELGKMLGEHWKKLTDAEKAVSCCVYIFKTFESTSNQCFSFLFQISSCNDE